MLSLTTLIAAAAAIGIQFGSEPQKDGGNTYIIQVEPELIDGLSSEGLSSDVPPGLRDIRRIEIRVGGGPLPNQGVTALKPPTEPGDAATPPRGDDAATPPRGGDAAVKPNSASFAVGAEQLPGGGNAFIVQIEPELLGVFRTSGFSSDMPPGLRDIRRIEVRVGGSPLPNQGLAIFQGPTVVKAAKPPVSDAAEPDPGSKHPATAVDPRNETARQQPRKLPSDLAASGFTATKDRSVEPASFQSRERPSTAADGGPSAAVNLSNSLGSPGNPSSRSPRDSDDWASIPLLAALGALIISAAANFYLLWVHLGTRRRYYEVVQQLHESELPIAVSSLEHD